MIGGYLSGIFASSPIGPLQQHMAGVLACVTELRGLTDAVIRGDMASRDAHHQRIVDLEHEADERKKDLRLHLPTSLFMPIDRRDMLEILTMQDEVAGAVRDVAGMICGRNMALPEPITEAYLQLVETCIRACEEADRAISELDELIETGFDNSERQRISAMLVELDATEHESDVQAAAIARLLMELEDDYHPVHVMFLYRVLDKTAEVADRAQRVGSRLQLTLAR
jgi:predicted phosphate transport protein (TIGR00153 family)